MTAAIRTRFAPSPTGDLHLGNARTALFAFLLARSSRGRLALRIDDSDAARNVAGAERRILEDLRWLGIEWDEGPDVGGPHGPYRQSERSEHHRAAAAALLGSGRAYRCFCPADDLDRRRAAARAERRAPRYDGRCGLLPAGESGRRAAAGEPCCVRLRLRPGAVRFDDAIRGTVAEDAADLDDFVVARSDGSAVFNLACAVDDHDMAVTDVVRSRDHLSNTVRQIFVAEALGWPPPRFAHLSLLAERGGRKLAKRRGARTIADLRAAGYVREAVVNHLALLGWSPAAASDGEPGPEGGLLSPDELLRRFSLEGCSTSDATPDDARLDWLARRHLARLGDAELAARAAEWARAAGAPGVEAARDAPWLVAAVSATREGAATLAQVWEPLAALASATPAAAGIAAAAGSDAHAAELLAAAERLLEGVAGWDAAGIAEALHRPPIEKALLPVIRLAATGSRSGPPLARLLAALGREKSIERLREARRALSA